jgi:hypothetical protein
VAVLTSRSRRSPSGRTSARPHRHAQLELQHGCPVDG